MHGIECVKTELIQKENETRKIPVNIDGTNYEIKSDMVIMAVGSKIEEKIIKDSDLKIANSYVYVNEDKITSNPKVYAGGDLIGAKSTVAWAARNGRDAAEKILEKIVNI